MRERLTLYTPSEPTRRAPVATSPWVRRHKLIVGLGLVFLAASIDPKQVGTILAALTVVVGVAVAIVVALGLRVVRRPVGSLTVFDILVAEIAWRWWRQRRE